MFSISVMHFGDYYDRLNISLKQSEAPPPKQTKVIEYLALRDTWFSKNDSQNAARFGCRAKYPTLPNPTNQPTNPRAPIKNLPLTTEVHRFFALQATELITLLENDDGWQEDGRVPQPVAFGFGGNVVQNVFFFNFWWGNPFLVQKWDERFFPYTFSKLEVFGLRVFGKHATQYLFFVLESFLAGEKTEIWDTHSQNCNEGWRFIRFFRYLGEKWLHETPFLFTFEFALFIFRMCSNSLCQVPDPYHELVFPLASGRGYISTKTPFIYKYWLKHIYPSFHLRVQSCPVLKALWIFRGQNSNHTKRSWPWLQPHSH